MEDLTYSNMTRYVVTKLEANSEFDRFRQRHPETASAYAHAIAEQANGAFLWLTVVVSSLLMGLIAGGRPEDLQIRLGQLASELQPLYERILDTIPSIYREDAARFLKLVSTYTEPPSLRLLWYADEVHFMKRVIYYVPGTVSTYDTKVLEGPDVRKKLDDYIKKPYDARLRVSAAYVVSIKLHQNEKSRARDVYGETIFHPLVVMCLSHAVSANPEPREETVRLLDYVRDTFAKTYTLVSEQSRSRVKRGSWQQRLPEIKTPRYVRDLDQEFLCLSTVFGVKEYIDAKANRQALVIIARRKTKGSHVGQVKLPWISWMLYESPVAQTSLFSLVRLADRRSPSIIKLLLGRGIEPSKAIYQIGNRKSTAWEEVLASAISEAEMGLSHEERSSVTECICLMIAKGAKVNSGTVERAFNISKECLAPRYLAWDSKKPIDAGSRAGIGTPTVLLHGIYKQLKNIRTDPNATFEIESIFALSL
ncbi:hypothetical protein FHETE_2424 [Fusarium heterosporum]|uniref:Uncharacterized protein n=1 Tax=Fusarium heterosporum TaxID=42747 RepID=A0A8H5TRA4_FUSHE|nr:hypothetical protein FHETE_2424 [Fusarium heterosporum]